MFGDNAYYVPHQTSLYSSKPVSYVSQIGLMYNQNDAMCILNWDIMTINSHYCESHWYIGLGRNTIVLPFYTRYLHVVINRCKLTGPGFLPYVDMLVTPILATVYVEVSKGKKKASEIKEWLEEFQQTVNTAAGNRYLQFTAEIWKNEANSPAPEKED